MTTLQRWLDTPGQPEIKQMVRAARDEQPNEGALEATLAAISVVGTSVVATQAATALGAGAKTTGATVTPLAIKWGAIGFLAGGLAVGGAVAQHTAQPQPVPSAVSVSRSASPAPRSAMRVPLAAQPSALPAPSASIRLAPSASIRATLPSSGAPASAAHDAMAAQELALVDRARAALERGRPKQTLRLLSGYETRFGAAARFRPEVSYLRMEALSQAGRTDEAREAARRILQEQPASPHTSRARATLRGKSP